MSETKFSINHQTLEPDIKAAWWFSKGAASLLLFVSNITIIPGIYALGLLAYVAKPYPREYVTFATLASIALGIAYLLVAKLLAELLSNRRVTYKEASSLGGIVFISTILPSLIGLTINFWLVAVIVYAILVALFLLFVRIFG